MCDDNENVLQAYIRNHPCQGFHAGPRYCPDSDILTVWFEDEECYSRDKGNGLTVYYAFRDARIVGCKLLGVKQMMGGSDGG